MRERFSSFTGSWVIRFFQQPVKVVTFFGYTFEEVNKELCETVSGAFADFSKFFHDFVLVVKKLLTVQDKIVLKLCGILVNFI